MKLTRVEEVLEEELEAAERIVELEEALQPFAKLADEVNGKDTDYIPCSMLCGDFNRARKALNFFVVTVSL